jgi:hypothetical protein
MKIDEQITMAVVDRPSHFTGAYEDYTNEDIRWVVSHFQVNQPITVQPFPGRGNINLHTYDVEAGGGQYLLQKVNSNVFAMPYRVMAGMEACINAQAQSLGQSESGWVPIELIKTRTGKTFLDLTDEHGWSVWRLMVRIPDSLTYKSLSELSSREAQLKLAEEVGRGLAIYSDLTSGIDPEGVEGSLPGYRDTALYFRQFHSVLAGNRTLGEAATLLPHDNIVRSSTEKHFLVHCSLAEYQRRLNDADLAPFIQLLKDQESFAMGLWTALGQGRIRPTLIHGDTKIENFLFDSQTGNVKSLVDLDTIMSFTWLADWGDMLRSMVNVAGEKERDLSRISVDTEVFLSVARGFLGASKTVTEQEISMMVQAVQVIALELGLRFLTDYLRGDSYFMLGEDDPEDLNRVRAMVQLTLFRKLLEFGPEAEDAIAKIVLVS